VKVVVRQKSAKLNQDIIASPCKTECQRTGKNSTRPILFSSLYLLKCDFCSSSDIDLKSSTKIVVFRNGGILSDDEKWYYNGLQIETVNSFTYLGVVLNFNGIFSVVNQNLKIRIFF
jgi:hypothetical protein